MDAPSENQDRLNELGVAPAFKVYFADILTKSNPTTVILRSSLGMQAILPLEHLAATWNRDLIFDDLPALFRWHMSDDMRCI